LVLLLALSLSALGFWQLRRLEQRKEYNQKISAKMAQERKSLCGLASEYNLETDIDDLSYLPVSLVGHFDTDNEILLRGRSYAGQAGYNILSPFIGENYAVLVERGWVPIQYDKPPIKEALPPGGEIVIFGKIYPGQAAPTDWTAALAPKDPEGKLKLTAYVDTKRIAKQLPYKILDFYIKQEKQLPPQNRDLPLALVPERLTNGNHFSYAMQWFSFVLIGLLGYALIIRKRLISGKN